MQAKDLKSDLKILLAHYLTLMLTLILSEPFKGYYGWPNSVLFIHLNSTVVRLSWRCRFKQVVKKNVILQAQGYGAGRRSLENINHINGESDSEVKVNTSQWKAKSVGSLAHAVTRVYAYLFLLHTFTVEEEKKARRQTELEAWTHGPPTELPMCSQASVIQHFSPLTLLFVPCAVWTKQNKLSALLISN